MIPHRVVQSQNQQPMACSFTLGQCKKFCASIEGMALLLIFSINLLLAAVLPMLKLPTGEDRGWLGFMWVVDFVLLSIFNRHNGDSGDGVVNWLFYQNVMIELVLVGLSWGLFGWMQQRRRQP